MMKHICATTGRAAAIALIAIALAGCGDGDTMELSSIRDVSDASKELYPEILIAGQRLMDRAESESDEALRQKLEQTANAYVDAAESASERIQQGYTLNFPEDRSIGTLTTRSHDSESWIELGEAQGDITVEPMHFLQMTANENFGDDDLKLISSFPAGAIEYLVLPTGNLTAEGFAHLPQLIGLRHLSFNFGDIDDDCLGPIGECYGLVSLNLMTCQRVTDQGISKLVDLPVLEKFAISGAEGFTDVGVYHLSKIDSLTSLFLHQQFLTDVTVDFLAEFENLKSISFFAEGITEHSLPLFAQLEDMESITIINSDLEHDMEREIKAQLPKCDIRISG